MSTWKLKFKIKHLFTKSDKYSDLQASMKCIAETLEPFQIFADFDFAKFKKLPKGNGTFKSTDYANKLLSNLYDYCDFKRIWIE